MSCPPPADLVRLALRDLDEARAAELREHVDRCPDCRAASSALVSAIRSADGGAAIDGDAGPALEPTPGDAVGRYVVLHVLGAGAAGVVCAAYDPELDRTVALKLLRARGDEADEHRLREGRALARLSHPNLVTLYEVGRAGDLLYLALELVDGVTLRQWIAIAPRAWPAVRDVFAQAARGLAALHRAGLVHRDVKPDNLLVDGQGRVKVVDLGLVGAAAGAGTPRYMAPEVRAGEVGDAAGDQYALAASLAECLGGGAAIDDPRRAIGGRAVRRLLARGLAAAPRDRFADLDGFAAALVDRPRRRLALVAAAAAVVVLAVAAVALTAAGRDANSCERRVERPLTAEAAAAIERSLLASGRSHAADTAARVGRRLQGASSAWHAERLAVCQAYHERRSISAARFDRQASCLDRTRRAFGAAVVRLRAGGAAVADHAVEIAVGLPDPQGCRDDDRLARLDPLPDAPAARAAIVAVEDRLAVALIAAQSGLSDAALADARAALAAAESLGRQELIARASQAIADELHRRGDSAGAREHLERAVRAAAAARADDVEARGWILDLYLGGVLAHRPPVELAAAERAAEAAARRAGDGRTRAALDNVLGLVAKAHGDPVAAARHLEAALDLFRRTDDRAPAIAATLTNLSMVQGMLGDAAGARASAEEALRRDRDTFGPRSPRVAIMLRNLANRLAEVGELDAAAAHLEEAIAIVRATDGDDGSPALTVHHSLANIYGQLGRLVEARREAERSLVLSERLLGPAEPDTASALLTLANVVAAEGDRAKAVTLAIRALDVFRAALGADHPMAAEVETSLAGWALEVGDPLTAERHLRSALRVKRASDERRDVAHIRTGLGEALLAQGKVGDAIGELEAATALYTELASDPADLADARFGLARALLRRGARSRASDLARQAFVALVAAGPPAADVMARLKAWAAEAGVALESG